MKNVCAAMAAALMLTTAVDASTVGSGFGFKSVHDVADGATEITWQGGGITLTETDDLLTVTITGKENLPFVLVEDEFGVETSVQTLTAWVVDWSMPMGEWNAFDLYLNPTFNDDCTILATPIVDNWDTMNQNLHWDQGHTSDGGYCTNDQNGAVLTVDLAVMPLPAGAMLLLTGVAGFGALRRFR